MAQTRIEPGPVTVAPADPAYGRVLVGVDWSAGSEAALWQGSRIAELTGAALELAHSCGAAMLPAAIAVEERWRVHDLLEDSAATARIEAETHLLLGDPALTLVREAEERWADLLCLGSPAAASPFRGSVTAGVLRRAPCSVLVAREAQARFPRLILVAVDGSADALEAVRQAATIARAAAAELRLLYVVPDTRGRGGGFAHGEAALARAALIAERHGTRPAQQLTLGRPAEVVVEVAEAAPADLLAVGSRGLRAARRFLLGGVAERVARAAGCSVLVARPRPG